MMAVQSLIVRSFGEAVKNAKIIGKYEKKAYPDFIFGFYHPIWLNWGLKTKILRPIF